MPTPQELQDPILTGSGDLVGRFSVELQEPPSYNPTYNRLTTLRLKVVTRPLSSDKDEDSQSASSGSKFVICLEDEVHSFRGFEFSGGKGKTS